MNSHIITDYIQVIYDNHDLIKSCIDTTLDEIYDFASTLKILDEDDPSVITLMNLADSYEILRRAFLDNKLSTLEVTRIKIILEHRLAIMQKKCEQLNAAINAVKNVIKKLS